MDPYAKVADLLTPLQPHQQRVIDKLRASGGVLVAHGLGSGKCARASTPIYTNLGVVTLGSLFGNQLEGPEDELTLDGGAVRILALVEGSLRSLPLRARYRQRLPDGEHTVKVTTARGHSVEVTLAHPMPVIREGFVQWVPAGELVEGDTLAVSAALPDSADAPEVPDELVELLAWQVAEGWEQDTTGRVEITQDNIPLLHRLRELFWSLHPESDTGHVATPKHKTPRIVFNCVAYRQRLEALGYTWGKRSRAKAFPANFVHLPRTQLRTLLRAFFEAEGYAGPVNIEVSTASAALATQIEYMLLRFGVRCARRTVWKAATNGTGIKRPYVRLTISGEDHAAFVEHIGFLSQAKCAASARKTKAKNPNFGVPVAWVADALVDTGITPKVLGLNNAGKSPTASVETAHRLAERLEWLASAEALDYYAGQLTRLGGTAYRFAHRTHLALQSHGDALRALDARLRALLALPLRYEPVTAVLLGVRGGFVYDLSVAAEDYDAQNYVAGPGGLILHNTLTSIAAGDQLDQPIDAVVPASLVPNYDKEFVKHLGSRPRGARIRSYEKAVRDGDVAQDGLAVMDEAHRARNTGTGISQVIAKQVANAKYRLLLTGTPVYNQPYDLAPLLNTAAGRKVLPDDPALFKQTFIGTEHNTAPLWEQLKGKLLGHNIETEARPTLINRDRLIQAARGYVDVHQGGGEGFPTRIDEDHHVDMGDEQLRMYKYHEGTMPWYLKAKIRAGLPMDKQESKELNAFQGALRQVSNTPRAYLPQMTDEEEDAHTPKIQKMVSHLKDMHAKDPNFRGIVYSNYLQSGLHPMSRALTKAGINHHVFTGEINPKARKTMVEDYNAGRVPVLLLSGAGSEGLDLKGTKAIQLMEPHWNESRIAQVIGRGIRYKSHEHLPEEERKVKVMRYYSAFPKDLDDRMSGLIGMKPKSSIEQYLKSMADEKGRISKQISGALQEASDMGPLQKRSAATDDAELLQRIADRIGDSELTRVKRKNVLRFRHPTGVTLDTAYDPYFVRKNVDEMYGGKHQEFADQVRDDLLNMGYATLGTIDKKNEQRQHERALKWLSYGSLAGSVLPLADMIARGKHSLMMRGMDGAAEKLKPVIERIEKVKSPLAHKALLGALGVGTTVGMFTAQAAPAVLASTAGYYLGKNTYTPFGANDVFAQNTHPLMQPPKAVKAKVKLDVEEK